MATEKDLELLDWFAGQALQGLLAGPNAPKKSGTESSGQYAVRTCSPRPCCVPGRNRDRQGRGS
jgi:hypothetical protein